MKTVWLFKSSESSDERYTDALSKAEFSAVEVPTLSFQSCNEGPLRDALQKPENHTGIIFISQHAVEEVAKVYRKLEVSIHQQWSEKKIFVIGEATQMAVQNLLKLPSIGQESGNIQQLADIIFKETQPFDKPLLYPCGNLQQDVLNTLLLNQDRDFRALTTYETSAHPSLHQTIEKLAKELAKGQMPDVAVFFSPSDVSFVVPEFEEFDASLADVKVVAIDPTTNTALVEYQQAVWGVCPSPTPEGLMHVLARVQ